MMTIYEISTLKTDMNGAHGALEPALVDVRSFVQPGAVRGVYDVVCRGIKHSPNPDLLRW